MDADAIPVAILFADITDSTRLYEEVGDAEARRQVAACMEAMIDHVRSNQGSVIKTMGDGLLATFPDADAAFRASLDMQNELRDSPLSVKIGFHVGQVIEADGDVFGDAVNLAARVSTLAKPGEALLTEETAELMSEPNRIQTRFFDTTIVKGKRDPVDLYTVVMDEDDDDATFVSGQALGAQVLMRRASLAVRYQDEEIVLDEDRPAIVIGRETKCDLVVQGAFASRRHMVIESKRERFVLTDQSTNGTYIINQASELLFLKRESVQLLGSGRIGLGENPDDNPENAIEYAYTGSTAADTPEQFDDDLPEF